MGRVLAARAHLAVMPDLVVRHSERCSRSNAFGAKVLKFVYETDLSSRFPLSRLAAIDRNTSLSSR